MSSQGQFGTVYAGGLVFKHRVPKAIGPWLNWYINRKRISHQFDMADLRRNSWRRPL